MVGERALQARQQLITHPTNLHLCLPTRTACYVMLVLVQDRFLQTALGRTDRLQP
jgi:hypothetical protein